MDLLPKQNVPIPKNMVPIKIGVPIPLTGVYGVEAAEQARCIELAVEEFNFNGGLAGRKAQALIRDTQMNSELAEKLTIELIEKDKVDFVAGALSALEMIKMGQICSERKIVYSGLSVGDGVVAKKNRSRYVFHEGPAAFGTAETMARYAFCHYGFKVALLIVNHPFGLDSLLGFYNVGNQIGVEFIQLEMHAFGETNYRQHLERILKTEADVLMTVNFGSDQYNMLKDINEMGIKNKMQVVCTYLSIPQRLKAGSEMFESIVGTSGYYWRLQEYFASAKKFNQAFHTKYGETPPAAHGTYAYCAVKALLEAALVSGAVDSESLIWGLESLRFDFARGPQFYRHLNHQAVQPVIVVKCNSESEMENPYDVFKILEISEFTGARAFHISSDKI